MLLRDLQLLLPPDVTGTVYGHGSEVSPCTVEWDVDGCCPAAGVGCACVAPCDTMLPRGTPPSAGNASTCVETVCPSQGPFWVVQAVARHPLLLVTPMANVLFYAAEATLYREPLALVVIVGAALAATALLKPTYALLGGDGAAADAGDGVAAAALALGAVGALLCAVDLPSHRLLKSWWCCGGTQTSSDDTDPARKSPGRAGGDRDGAHATPLLPSAAASPLPELRASLQTAHNTPAGAVASRHDSFSIQSASSRQETRGGEGWGPRTLRILPAFATMAGCSCLWWVLSASYALLMRAMHQITHAFCFLRSCVCDSVRVYSAQYRVNAIGFNSMDQMAVPLFLFPMLWLLELFNTARGGDAAGGSRTRGWSALSMKSASAASDSGASAATSRASRANGGVVPSSCATFCATVRGAWSDLRAGGWSGWMTIFGYRLLANSRAVAYSYMAVWYPLESIFFEVTLVRVLTAWGVSLFTLLCLPRFIRLKGRERDTALAPAALLGRAVGSMLVVAALVLMS